MRERKAPEGIVVTLRDLDRDIRDAHELLEMADEEKTHQREQGELPPFNPVHFACG